MVGPSGSGKTTLLHVMGSLDRPSTGTREDHRVWTWRACRTGSSRRCARAGWGSCSSSSSSPSTPRLLDNVADGLLYAGVPIRQRARTRGRGAGRGRAPDRLHARPTQISGGQRQRVAIARALVGSPAIVLADEPTGNLDQATGQAILDLLEELHAGGTTIVVITHDEHIAARMPRRVEMLDGRIVSRHRPPHARRRSTRMTTTSALVHAPDAAGRSGPPVRRWACAPASCAPPCPRSASPSASPRSSPCSASRRPPRPGC